jgi:hypothetical protein
MIPRTYRAFGIIVFAFAFVCITGGVCSAGQETEYGIPKQVQSKIAMGSKVYIVPMGGFETYLKAAILKEKVPIQIVERQVDADYEITKVSDNKTAGAAKSRIKESTHSNENASIEVSSLKYHEIVYAFSVHEKNSTHGEQSSAEAWAKHLKGEGVASK